MIKLQRVKTESRQRDVKRRRWLLTIGTQSWHLTAGEVAYLRKRLR